MRPRFVGEFGPADLVTVANAVVGFFGIVAAVVAPNLAARLILLAAIGDGLDGVVARHFRSTPVGEHLDSLSDVVSFGVAPAVLVVMAVTNSWDLPLADPSLRLVVAVAIPALYTAMVVVRLGLYTVYDAGDDYTEGVPSTLAATLLAAMVLTGIETPAILLFGTAMLAFLMVTTITYPDLLARDAFIMGIVQAVAVLVPTALGRAFPYAVLFLGVSYLCLSPRFYWRSLTTD